MTSVTFGVRPATKIWCALIAGRIRRRRDPGAEQHSTPRPAPVPQGANSQHTENSVFRDVGGFAQIIMDRVVFRPRQLGVPAREETNQQSIYPGVRVGGRTGAGGQKEDQRQPSEQQDEVAHERGMTFHKASKKARRTHGGPLDQSLVVFEVAARAAVISLPGVIAHSVGPSLRTGCGGPSRSDSPSTPRRPLPERSRSCRLSADRSPPRRRRLRPGCANRSCSSGGCQRGLQATRPPSRRRPGRQEKVNRCPEFHFEWLLLLLRLYPCGVNFYSGSVRSRIGGGNCSASDLLRIDLNRPARNARNVPRRNESVLRQQQPVRKKQSPRKMSAPTSATTSATVPRSPSKP